MSDESMKAEPFAELIPDTPPPKEHKAPHTVEQGAGFLELGFYVDGVRVVLARKKAGGFLDDRARLAKTAKKPSGK